PYELRRVAFLFVLALGGGIPIIVFDLPLTIRLLIAFAFPVCLKFFGFFRKDELVSIRQIFNRRVLKA
ncbi:MAG: hypothetical protein COT43_09645, partial [Candidatus Marinimicrobia bacterium CG08_land_8_20_14_0_20_45_22]